MDYLSNQTIKNISIFLFTFYLFSCGSSEVDNWERKEGKYYVKGSNELFTGVIKSNGVLKYHANVLNGFYHGIYRRYDNDNVLLEELMYNNGKKHGISRTRVTSNSSFIEISWENGKIKIEPTEYTEKTTTKTQPAGNTKQKITKTEPTQSNYDRRAVREFAIETSLLGGGSTEIRNLQSLGNDMWIVMLVHQNNSSVIGLFTMALTYKIKCNGNKLEVVDVATEILH